MMDNENKAQEAIQLITAMLIPIPRDCDIKNNPEFCCKGGTVLCPNEEECEIAAEFFRNMVYFTHCLFEHGRGKVAEKR